MRGAEDVEVRVHQWRGVIEEYRDLLDIPADTPAITLREGGTPLVHSEWLSEVSGAVNIGSGVGTTNYELMHRVGQRLHREHLVHVDQAKLRQPNASVLVADVNRLAGEVGWHPSIGLEDGVRRTITEIEGKADAA